MRKLGKNIIGVFFMLMFMFIGCNNNKHRQNSIIPVLFRSTESRLQHSYYTYLKKMNPSGIYSMKQEVGEYMKWDNNYLKECSSNSDYFFKPPTQWQVKYLNGEADWEKDAIEYSSIVCQIDSICFFDKGIYFQNIFLSSLKMSKGEKYLKNVVNNLGRLISISEKELTDNQTRFQGSYEILLENEMLFFATEETGDPVYRDFAIQNTIDFYKSMIDRNMRIVSVLNTEHLKNCKVLTTEDFSKLAVALFGLTTLYNETGIEEYGGLCEKIASLFQFIFDDEDGDFELIQALKSRIDLVSQCIVCHALFQLSANSKFNHIETSTEIYKHVLDVVETVIKQKHSSENNFLNSKISFRLFYYLFDYEIKKQNI